MRIIERNISKLEGITHIHEIEFVDAENSFVLIYTMIKKQEGDEFGNRNNK